VVSAWLLIAGPMQAKPFFIYTIICWADGILAGRPGKNIALQTLWRFDGNH
jgi:hypothetical protein